MKNDAKSQKFRLRRHLTQTSTSHEGAKQGGNLKVGGEFKGEYDLILIPNPQHCPEWVKHISGVSRLNTRLVTSIQFLGTPPTFC